MLPVEMGFTVVGGADGDSVPGCHFFGAYVFLMAGGHVCGSHDIGAVWPVILALGTLPFPLVLTPVFFFPLDAARVAQLLWWGGVWCGASLSAAGCGCPSVATSAVEGVQFVVQDTFCGGPSGSQSPFDALTMVLVLLAKSIPCLHLLQLS